MKGRLEGLGSLRALLAVLLFVLTACGGGGGGGEPPPPPIIVATLLGFPAGAVPPGAVLTAGANAVAAVAVFDADSGAPVTDARVQVNGLSLAYVPDFQDYEVELKLDPGATVTLSVSTAAGTFTSSGRQFSSYPAILQPAANANWASLETNLVSWTAVAPADDALYALAVLDSGSGELVWPGGDIGMLVVPPSTTSYAIPPGSLSAGNRLVLVGVATALPIANAHPDSGFVLGGFSYVPVTVLSGVGNSLVSIAVTPARATITKAATLQLVATGTYSDGSQRDLTDQVSWTSSAPAAVGVGSGGLASGVDYGSATVTASLGGVAGTATVNVWQPTPSAAPPLGQSVAFQIDYGHSGRAVLGAPLAFPAAARWSATLSGAVSYPLVADGKVFVTAAASPGGAYGTRLYAFDLQTGAAAWGPVDIAGTYYWSGLAYDHGKVFVVNFDGLLRSFDAATGAPGWSVKLPGQYAFSAPPTAANGVVYVGGAGSGGTLYAVDEASGALLWTAAVANGDASSPAVSAAGVFVAYPCQAYAFDLYAGAPLWHHAGPCSGGGGSTPAYADGRLYVRDLLAGGQIFDTASGTLVGSFDGGTPMPALAPQTQYLLSAGTLRAIDLDTRAVRWSFAGDGQLVSAPIVVNDAVFVGSASGRVYALDAATGSERWSGLAGSPLLAESAGVTRPTTGLGAGEGHLVVPASDRLQVWRIVSP